MWDRHRKRGDYIVTASVIRTMERRSVSVGAEIDD